MRAQRAILVAAAALTLARVPAYCVDDPVPGCESETECGKTYESYLQLYEGQDWSTQGYRDFLKRLSSVAKEVKGTLAEGLPPTAKPVSRKEWHDYYKPRWTSILSQYQSERRVFIEAFKLAQSERDRLMSTEFGAKELQYELGRKTGAFLPAPYDRNKLTLLQVIKVYLGDESAAELEGRLALLRRSGEGRDFDKKSVDTKLKQMEQALRGAPFGAPLDLDVSGHPFLSARMAAPVAAAPAPTPAPPPPAPPAAPPPDPSASPLPAAPARPATRPSDLSLPPPPSPGASGPAPPGTVRDLELSFAELKDSSKIARFAAGVYGPGYQADSAVSFLSELARTGAAGADKTEIYADEAGRLVVNRFYKDRVVQELAAFEPTLSGWEVGRDLPATGLSVYHRSAKSVEDKESQFVRTAQYLGNWGKETVRLESPKSNTDSWRWWLSGPKIEQTTTVTRLHRAKDGSWEDRGEKTSSTQPLYAHAGLIGSMGQRSVDLVGAAAAGTMSLRPVSAAMTAVFGGDTDALQADMWTRAKANVSGDESSDRYLHRVGEEMTGLGHAKAGAALQGAIDGADQAPLILALGGAASALGAAGTVANAGRGARAAGVASKIIAAPMAASAVAGLSVSTARLARDAAQGRLDSDEGLYAIRDFSRQAVSAPLTFAVFRPVLSRMWYGKAGPPGAVPVPKPDPAPGPTPNPPPQPAVSVAPAPAASGSPALTPPGTPAPPASGTPPPPAAAAPAPAPRPTVAAIRAAGGTPHTFRESPFGSSGIRVTDADAAAAYREQGGWKLNVTVDPKNHKSVDQWLWKNHAGQYKLQRGGASGDDFTIHVGDKALADNLAARMHSELGGRLEPYKGPAATKFGDRIGGVLDVRKPAGTVPASAAQPGPPAQTSSPSGLPEQQAIVASNQKLFASTKFKDAVWEDAGFDKGSAYAIIDRQGNILAFKKPFPFSNLPPDMQAGLNSGKMNVIELEVVPNSNATIIKWAQLDQRDGVGMGAKLSPTARANFDRSVQEWNRLPEPRGVLDVRTPASVPTPAQPVPQPGASPVQTGLPDWVRERLRVQQAIVASNQKLFADRGMKAAFQETIVKEHATVSAVLTEKGAISHFYGNLQNVPVQVNKDLVAGRLGDVELSIHYQTKLIDRLEDVSFSANALSQEAKDLMLKSAEAWNKSILAQNPGLKPAKIKVSW